MRVVSVFAEFAQEVPGGATTGVIVGHIGDGRDYVLWCVPTPKQGQSIDTQWLVEHSRQVMRSLCGGVSVLGFYHVGPDTTNDAFDRQVMQGRSAWEANWRHYNPLHESVPAVLVMHINDKPTRLLCRQVTLSGRKEMMSAVELKTQEKRLDLVRLTSSFSVSANYFAPANYPTTVRSLRAWADQLQSRLAECACLINNKTTITQSSTETLADVQLPEQEVHRVEIFIPLSQTGLEEAPEVPNKSYPHTTKISTTSPNHEIVLTGVIEACTFGHAKDSVSDVVVSLCDDVLRSLLARIEVLEDDQRLQLEGTDQQARADILVSPLRPTTAHCLPRRAFWNVPGSYKLVASDYMVEGEDEEECLERCVAIMGAPDNTKLEFWEEFPSAKDKLADAAPAKPKEPTPASKTNSHQTNNLAFLISVCIAAIAAVVAWTLLDG